MQQNFGKLLLKGVFHPYAIPRHVKMMTDIFARERTIATIARDIHDRADSKPGPIHTVVLSDEDICTRPDPTILGQFRDHFDVTVVMLMRRQDLWLESWYSQNVKWQWNPDLAHLPFEAFLDRRKTFFWINYDQTVRTFETVFGADNVICRPFEAEQMPEGPVQAFCDMIGLRDLKGLDPVPPTNRSLSPLMTEFMRTLPLDKMDIPVRHKVEQACMRADALLAKRTGRPSMLLMDAQTRADILGEHAAGNAALARRKFAREDLFLAPVPAADAALATRTLPADSYALVDLIIAPLIAEIAAEFQKDMPPAAK